MVTPPVSPTIAGTMTAIYADEYGPLDGLALRDVPRPTPGPNEVLIQVAAAGLNPADVFTVTGNPFAARLASGLRRPRWGVPGHDGAGTVVAVGSKVTDFVVGDEVFGGARGTCAEFAVAAPKRLARRPEWMPPMSAAALVMAGLAALHGLRAAKVSAGQRVLIIGASGGIGSAQVQLASDLGAHVTGVTSTGNVDFVHSLGAEEVIDYTREDFTLGVDKYDVIIDNVENRTVADIVKVLTPTGTLILNSGTGSSDTSLLKRMLWPLFRSLTSRQKIKRYISTPNRADLDELASLWRDGVVRPNIERTYPLPETVAALERVATGHVRGKLVITVNHPS